MVPPPPTQTPQDAAVAALARRVDALERRVACLADSADRRLAALEGRSHAATALLLDALHWRPSEPTVNALRRWTELNACRVVYDSDRVGFDQAAFVRAVAGRASLALVLEASPGLVFGAFVPSAVALDEWTLDRRFFLFCSAGCGGSAPARWFRTKAGDGYSAYALWLNPPGSPTWFQVGCVSKVVVSPAPHRSCCRGLSDWFDGIAQSSFPFASGDHPFELRRLVAVVLSKQ